MTVIIQRTDQVVQIHRPGGQSVVIRPTGQRGQAARASMVYSYQGAVEAGEVLPGNPVADPAVYTDLVGYCRVPAAADAVFLLLNRVGAQVGTVTFPAGETAPVLDLAGGALAVARGDYIHPVAPAVQDAALADPAFTLFGD